MSLLLLRPCPAQPSPAADPGLPSFRGRIESVTRLGARTVDDVRTYLRAKKIPHVLAHGVVLYRILYATPDVRGRETVASGVVAVPAGLTEPAPLVSFQHGTVTARDRVASVYGFDPVSLVLGSSGYVTVLPDYLGLGASEGLHPYVHAASLATAIVDLLRAARTFCRQEGVALNGQLFLTGYSEGGYATLAAHRALERDHAREFTVTASAPMAGPYDLSGAMAELMLRDAPYPAPVYLPYLLLAYDEVYGLFGDPATVFAAPYAATVPPLFDGRHHTREINARLPEVPSRMLHPDLLARLEADPDDRLLAVLRENDLTDWAPRAPVRLFHCTDDDQIPFRNAERALAGFRARGAADVELVALPFGDHNACAAPALFLGKKWLDALRAPARTAATGRPSVPSGGTN